MVFVKTFIDYSNRVYFSKLNLHFKFFKMFKLHQTRVVLKINSFHSHVLCVMSLTHLVERDKLGVQAHQVSGLRHLTDHERDEGGVALPLLPSQRGLRQQHAGIYGIFN